MSEQLRREMEAAADETAPTPSDVETRPPEAIEALWVLPQKPDNISTGRHRIADGLEARGHTVHRRADRRAAARALRRQDVDVLLGSSAAVGLFAPVAKLQRAGVVVDYVDPISQYYRTSDSWLMPRVADALLRTAVRLADGVLYVYDEVGAQVRGKASIVERTRLGVDYARFADPAPSPAVDDVLDDRGVSDGFAVYVGGLEPIYNVDDMVAAAARADTELVVAGCGSEQHHVETAAATTGDVHYLGVIDHERVPALLARAGVGVCLVDDPHTVKTLEYAAAGLPIVHAAGRAEGVVPPQWATFVDPANHENVAAVMDALAGWTPVASSVWPRHHDYGAIVDQYERVLAAVA